MSSNQEDLLALRLSGCSITSPSSIQGAQAASSSFSAPEASPRSEAATIGSDVNIDIDIDKDTPGDIEIDMGYPELSQPSKIVLSPDVRSYIRSLFARYREVHSDTWAQIQVDASQGQFRLLWDALDSWFNTISINIVMLYQGGRADEILPWRDVWRVLRDREFAWLRGLFDKRGTWRLFQDEGARETWEENLRVMEWYSCLAGSDRGSHFPEEAWLGRPMCHCEICDSLRG